MISHRAWRLLALALALSGAACGDDTGVTPRIANVRADSADQVLSGVRVALHDEGLLRGRLVADTAYVYDESTRFEMVNVRVTFATATGADDGTLTAREGTYNTRLGTMEARGDVVVTNPDGRRLETQQLRYVQSTNQISSDSAFVATMPDGRRVEGVGFVSDPELQNIRIKRTTGGLGGSFVIPNQ